MMDMVLNYDDADICESIYYIYALVDPRDAADKRIVRYVGVTEDPVKRLEHHITRPTNDAMRTWVQGLYAADRTPKMIIVDILRAKRSQKAERYWINHFQSEYLLNAVCGPVRDYTPKPLPKWFPPSMPNWEVTSHRDLEDAKREEVSKQNTIWMRQWAGETLCGRFGIEATSANIDALERYLEIGGTVELLHYADGDKTEILYAYLKSKGAAAAK